MAASETSAVGVLAAAGVNGSGYRSGSSSSRYSNSKSSSSTGKGSTTSSAGGATKQGSGVQPSFAGGRYSGGATSPYSSGLRSPLGIAPVFLGVAALSVFPGIWLYGAYSYPYTHPYTFRNHSATNSSTSNSTAKRDSLDMLVAELMARQDTTGVNQTKPVDCLCAAYAECGCDDNGSTTLLDQLIGDGTYANLNQSLVNVVDVNGTSTIVLNGTLENGTTVSGGTEDANSALGRNAQSSGYLALVMLVGFTVYFV